jgi:hypothetical protein
MDIRERLMGLPHRKKMLVLLLLSLLLLSIFITADRFYVDAAVNTDPETDHTDNQLYIERAQTILDGNLLYRDVDTRTPPLINYLLVPPVAAGGTALAFEIYFSMFIVLTTLSLYHYLSRVDDQKAFYGALAFLLLPSTLVIPSFARQDESIVVLFFLLPLLSMVASQRRWLYSAGAALGVWIKMHSVFLVPPFLIRERRHMLRHVAVMAIVSLAATLPFLILAYDEFMWHLRFYLLGKGEKTLQGISLWRILDSQGVAVPKTGLIIIMGILFLAVYIMAYRRSLGVWKTVALTLLIYFVVYPKIHYEYYLVLFGLLSPYVIENRLMTAGLFGISLLSGATLLIEQRYLDWGTTAAHDDLFIALAAICMLAIDVILVVLFRYIAGHETWLDREPLV